MTMEIVLSFVVTMVISSLLMPILIKAGSQLDIVAHMNRRTVHKKEVVRIGGYGVYLATLIGTLIFLKTDTQINSILIAGFLIFMIGLYDDIHDLSPKIKLIVELIAALIVIFWGDIYLRGFNFIPESWQLLTSQIITIIWIIGITNAINLIDGLDGLSSGISIIVLFTISMTSLMSGRSDIAALALVLSGALMGFLFFNFHPAKIFLGDCGSLFVGFMISVISLLGFGYSVSAFFTLGAPIVVLMIPIMDTLIAIVRRKINHRKFSDADRKHLHHNLMFRLKLGHRKSVLILYTSTVLFSLTSYLYYYDATLGMIMFIVLMVVFELFIEITNMISSKYKPILTIINIFVNSDNLPKIKFLSEYRAKRTLAKKRRDHTIILVCLLLLISASVYYVGTNIPVQQKEEIAEIPYPVLSDSDELNQIYERLENAYVSNRKEDECRLVAAYFVSDYFTLSDKEEGEIGGLEYVYPDNVIGFEQYAKESFYSRFNENKKLRIVDFDIVSYAPSRQELVSLENADYYNVTISYAYNDNSIGLETTSTVTLVFTNNRYYVVSIDNA